MNSYEHINVVHKYNFVCPVTGTHTQNVERWNNKLKLKIKVKRLNSFGRSNFFQEFFFWKYSSPMHMKRCLNYGNLIKFNLDFGVEIFT